MDYSYSAVDVIEFLHLFELTDRKAEHQSMRQNCSTASGTGRPNRIALPAHIKIIWQVN